VESPGTVLAMTLKADGKALMLGTCERGVWLSEDGGRGGAASPFTPDSPVLSAALGPEAKLILTGHEDRMARVWGADGKAIGKPLSLDAPVRAVAVSADSKVLATAAGKTVRLWDGTTHLPLGRPLLHEADVFSVAFTPDGKGLLAGDQAGAVHRWTVPGPLVGEVPRVKLWVEVMAGKELDAKGGFRALGDKERLDRKQKLQELGGPLTP
jgi:WD40 repeat protein